MNALVEELGIEVRHFVATVHSFPDAHLKKELAERALQLSERAEAITNSMDEPEIIEINIGRYQRRMRAGGLTNKAHRKIIDEMLANDAQTLLTNLHRETPTPNVARRDLWPHINAASSVRTINP